VSRLCSRQPASGYGVTVAVGDGLVGVGDGLVGVGDGLVGVGDGLAGVGDGVGDADVCDADGDGLGLPDGAWLGAPTTGNIGRIIP
jgi:hypothetical protein